MKLKIANCNLFISPLFMGMIALLLFMDQTGFMGWVLGAMAIHELGHLVAMILVGCPPKEVRFLPFEINMVANQSCANTWERFFVAVGGILLNLFMCLVFAGSPFGYINCSLGLFNALPLYSMDGYQILFVLLEQKGKWLFRVSMVITLVVLGIGCFLFFKQKNPMLLLFSIYLISLGVIEKRKYTSG